MDEAKNKGSKTCFKKYGFKKSDFKIDEKTGLQYTIVYSRDVWEIPSLGSDTAERIGYVTQKPEALIKKIVQCSTDRNNIVLDFFGGGGTTAKVCVDLNRKFIIGDVSPVAMRGTADRLSFHGYRNYEIKALPSTKKEYLSMNPHKFADMICELMG